MIRPCILMFWSFIHVFMFCDLGEKVSNGFDTLNESIFIGDWYTLPIEIQRILPTILLATQKPVTLRGFGNIPCMRQTFRKVSWILWKKHWNCTFIVGIILRLRTAVFHISWFFGLLNKFDWYSPTTFGFSIMILICVKIVLDNKLKEFRIISVFKYSRCSHISRF